MVIINNIELDGIKNSGGPQNASLRALIHDIYCGVTFAKPTSNVKESKAFDRKIIVLGIRYKCLS